MSISFLFSPSIKTVFYLFLASWFPFVSIQKDRMPRAELTPNLMSFIAFENSLLLKRNDCSPKYIFRDVLPDTSGVFSYRMILSVIWSFFFYFFFSCEVFYSLSNISLWFHLSIFSWVVTFTPLSIFFYFMAFLLRSVGILHSHPLAACMCTRQTRSDKNLWVVHHGTFWTHTKHQAI